MWTLLRWMAGLAQSRNHVPPMQDDEVTDHHVRPWTPVRSVRGRFIHMTHDGTHTLCGVRLRTLVAEPDREVDCFECYQALTFN